MTPSHTKPDGVMKFLFFLILSATLVSCNGGGNDDADITSDQNILNSPDNLAREPGVPAVAYDFESNMYLTNFNASEEAKMKKAIEIIKLVVATEEFKEKILNYSYNGENKFVDSQGLTNAQIYQKILEGAERLSPTVNYTMDGEIELFFEDSRTIGYTYQNTPRIWVNTKYFSTYTAAGVAHNLMHEWMHKLGFTHSSSWNASREHSVPYAVGYILGDIGNYFL